MAKWERDSLQNYYERVRFPSGSPAISGGGVENNNNNMEKLYEMAQGVARGNHQVVGRTNDYYITLEQLNSIIEDLMEEYEID